MEQQQQQNKESKADKIRTLTAQGMKPRDIAATVGTTLQAVYDVQYRDRRKAAKARAKQRAAQKKLASMQAAPTTPTVQTVRISERTGLPVRKYTKRKATKMAKKSLAERGTELKRLVEGRRAEQAAMVHYKYIEVPVPQPHYNLTWKQRFKALFTGRV